MAVFLVALGLAEAGYRYGYGYSDDTPFPTQAPVVYTSAPTSTDAPTQASGEPPTTNAPTPSGYDPGYGGDISGNWFRIPSIGSPPSERSGHSLTAISRPGSVSDLNLILFGGSDNVNVFADTYEWNPVEMTWQLLPILGNKPPARMNHGAAAMPPAGGPSDSAKLYIWGGVTLAGDDLVDIWELDYGRLAWKQLYGQAPHPNDPDVLSRLGFFYEDATATALVIGVFDDFGTPQFAQWQLPKGNNGEWDWFTLTDDFPVDLDTDYPFTGSLQYRAGVKKIVAVNIDGVKELPFDSATLTVGATTYVDSNWILRDGYGVTLVGPKLFLACGEDYSGDTSVNVMDVKMMDLSQPTPAWTTLWTNSDATQGRQNLPIAVQGGQVYLFGGEADQMMNDMWAVTIASSSGKMVHGEQALMSPRAFQTAVSVGATVVIFGGRGGDQPFTSYNDVYTIALDTGLLTQLAVVNTPPPVRSGHTALGLGVGMIVFGGSAGSTYYNDVWAFSVLAKSWTQLGNANNGAPAPKARAGHVAAAFGGSMVVFGGHDNSNSLVQPTLLWFFNIEGQTWSSVTIQPNPDAIAPGPTASASDLAKYQRQAYHMFADQSAAVAYGNLLVLIGGVYGQDFTDMVATINVSSPKPYWTFYTAGSSWNLGTPLANGQAVLFVNNVVLYGGRSRTEFYADAQVLDLSDPNSQWQNINPMDLADPQYTGPRCRVGHSAFANADVMGIVGGLTCAAKTKLALSSNMNTPDTWVFPTNGLPCLEGSVTEFDGTGARFGATARVINGSSCLLCPAGKYGDRSSQAGFCFSCARGRYGPMAGAVTDLACLPCPAGTYTNNSGTATCLACPANKTCAVGAFLPDAENLGDLSTQETNPVAETSKNADTASAKNLIVIIVAVVTFGILVILCLILFCLEKSKHRDMEVPIVDKAFDNKNVEKLAQKEGDKSAAPKGKEGKEDKAKPAKEGKEGKEDKAKSAKESKEGQEGKEGKEDEKVGYIQTYQEENEGTEDKEGAEENEDEDKEEGEEKEGTEGKEGKEKKGKGTKKDGKAAKKDAKDGKEAKKDGKDATATNKDAKAGTPAKKDAKQPEKKKYASVFTKLDVLHKPAAKNCLGGWFAIFWIFAVIFWGVSVIIPVAYNNVIEQRSVLPMSFLDATSSGGDITLSVALLDYVGQECVAGEAAVDGSFAGMDGPCAATLSVKSDLQGNTTCSSKNGACTLTWVATGAKLGAATTPTTLNFMASNTFATSLNYSIITSAGYPTQSNSIKGVFASPNGLVFRGVKPITLGFSLIQVMYQNTIDSKNGSGFLLSSGDRAAGSTLTVSSFHEANGVSVEFDLTLNGGFFVQVMLQPKLEISVLITVLLGLVATAKGIITQVLNQLEKYGPILIKILLCKATKADFQALKGGLDEKDKGKDKEGKDEEEGGGGGSDD